MISADESPAPINLCAVDVPIGDLASLALDLGRDNCSNYCEMRAGLVFFTSVIFPDRPKF